MSKTRESLFSMLEARGIDWNSTNILDLFAGTGSLAFEAISRGSPRAVLVENNQEQCAAIARSAADLDIAARIRIVRQDVKRFLHNPAGQAFDLVFVDPPYRRNYALPVIKALLRNNWLSPGAFVVAELENGTTLPELLGLQAAGERIFGQTILRIWKKTEILQHSI